MDLVPILHQIDVEITKLQRIREIVQELARPRRRVSGEKPRRSRPNAVTPIHPASVPELIILPPKPKREYSPRLKPTPVVSRALGPAPSDRPVFVPRVSVAPRTAVARGTVEARSLEAVVRQNLLGAAV